MERIDEKNLQRGVKVFAFVCAIGLLLFVLLPLKGAAEIYSGVLRFHVVAHSDSAKDQSIKLLVRDYLLDLVGEELAACEDRAQAERLLEDRTQMLMQKAREYLRTLGVTYSASAALCDEVHEAKTYEDITLPAGQYRSYRVVLGDGAGENFFCVLFPPICKKTAAKSASQVFFDYGYSAGSSRILKTREGKDVRFFALDFFRGRT